MGRGVRRAREGADGEEPPAQRGRGPGRGRPPTHGRYTRAAREERARQRAARAANHNQQPRGPAEDPREDPDNPPPPQEEELPDIPIQVVRLTDEQRAERKYLQRKCDVPTAHQFASLRGGNNF